MSVEEFKGRKFVDCRIRWQDTQQNTQGAWKSSKNGIALSEETIDEVIEALQRVRDELRTNQA